MVLLIDFDEDEGRLAKARKKIPPRLSDRVFVLGAWNEPEDLTRSNLGSLEEIGRALAKDCHDNTDETWSHALLRHNASEIDRLRNTVRPILF